MHLYLRLLKPELDYTQAEQLEVTQVLSRAPGVAQVKLVERHHKGGYAATLDAERDSFDELIEYLVSNRLQSVF
jgi:hypothetical protein